MAEIDIPVEISVGSGGAKSLSDLKKEFKDLQKELSNTKEGTKEYQLALQKLGAVKDDIGDLRDTINALNPEGKVAAFAKVGSTIASGFAAAQGAAALFGAESEELQKTMLKVQAAMALAEGIKGITAAGDAFRVLNAVMAANPIAAIALGFAALATAAYAVYENFFKAATAAESLEKQHQKLIESTKALNKEYDTQIKNLSGLKSTETEVIALKEKQIKANIDLAKSSLTVALAKQAEAEASSTLEETLLRASGNEKAADILRFSRLQEQRASTQQSIAELKSALADLSNFHNVQEQKKLDITQAANEKSVKDHQAAIDKKKAADQKEFDELFARLQQEAQIEADIEAFKKGEKKQKQKEEQDELDAFVQAEIDSQIAQQAADDAALEYTKKTEAEKRAEKQKTVNDNLAATKQGLQATQALTDLYFAHQLKQVKGQADKEREIRKKQFQVNKAFGIANAVVDGIGAVQKALNNPYPLNIVLAVISGLAAAVNIAKIASAKFDDGGGSSGSAGDVGSLGSTAQAPVIPQPNNTTTKISDDGKVENVAKPQPQKVFVVETDIKNSNDRVANIEESAKIG